MKKRFVSMLLAVVLLISLLPVAGMTASAASKSVSERAITVLKQLEGYRQECDESGHIGYGTRCPEKVVNNKTHGSGKHAEMKEVEANEALREELEKLDKAVNSFASKKGISLSQSQHDALVLFSFQNGTAWTTGTGDLQSAVANKADGSEFLTAICNWSTSDSNLRRKIEANMYLHGVYQTWAPGYFIEVTLDPNGGSMSSSTLRYYDVSYDQVVGVTPTKAGSKFIGWYLTKENNSGTVDTGAMITEIDRDLNGKTLYARWQDSDSIVSVWYLINESDLASKTMYTEPNGKARSAKINQHIQEDDTIPVYKEYVDEDGVRWCRISADGEREDWVKLKTNVNGGSVASDSGPDIDVTVTVTNSYVRRRVNATIFSAQNGSYNQGEQLRIINTANKDGFLWGQVAKSSDDDTPVGWVALMYTNFESVKDSDNADNSSVVGKALITATGYVNVRNGAGTHNQIVSALPYNTQVDLYETTYVNGIRWGRCSSGWFCLSYAKVTDLVDTDDEKGTGLISYAFAGTMKGTYVYEAPGVGAELKKVKDLDAGTEVIVTHLTLDSSGRTWGKISDGWVCVTDAQGNPVDVNLYTAKFEVITDSVSVRQSYSTDSKRVDTLVEGVEFSTNKTMQVVVKDATVWGYADKLGEDDPSYGGWVNLDSRYVRRVDAPDVDFGDDDEEDNDEETGLIATVINTDKVNVRITGATYGKIIGSLPRGTTAKVLRERDGWYELDVDVDDNEKTGTWVSGEYLDVREGTIDSADDDSDSDSGSTAVKTGTGIVANTYRGVNVRTAPGTGNAIVGMILPGTEVKILEVKQHGAADWGRTDKGWICMDYVTMLRYEEISGSTGTSGGSTVTGSETAIYTGYVKEGVEVVNIRKDTYETADVVRTLTAGDPVTIHEILTVTEEETITTEDDDNAGSSSTVTTKTYYWARVNDGYIRNPGDHLVLHTLDEKTYTVTETDALKIRASAPDGEILDVLEKGDQVTITQVKIIKGSVWGYAEVDHELEGWVSLAYMTAGAVNVKNESSDDTNNSGTGNNLVIGDTGNTGTGGFVTNTGGYKYTGTVTNTNELNVRATASTGAAKTTTLKGGQSLVIYETTIAENMAWGRCDAGWVYLYYVDLSPSSGNAIDARVVYNDNTIIYSDSECSSTVGTYSRMSVIDIYEVVGKMARTDLGWVSTDNLLS